MTPDEATMAVPRTIRVNSDLWDGFLALTLALDPNGSASGRLRALMQELLDEYAVFMAPEAEEIDPAAPRIAWYDCEEHDQPHRVLGQQPWGCSVAKAREDRLAAKASAP